jgi:hypothetical protein
MTDQHASSTEVVADDLATMASARVFFGHQSVGQNVLDGVRGVYESHGQQPPPVQDAFIGENEDPLSKIEDFAARMRAGLGDQVDVAMMKLCYIDITTQTDVDALFETYRTTMAGLERDLPTVTFVHVTAPLMTEPSRLSSVKARLTGSTRYGPAENATRERLNRLVRREYADRHLFDLAAVESTTPTGSRVGGQHDGTDYYALHDGYASDNGHLNATGAQVAATAWIATVARAARQAKE